MAFRILETGFEFDPVVAAVTDGKGKWKMVLTVLTPDLEVKPMETGTGIGIRLGIGHRDSSKNGDGNGGKAQVAVGRVLLSSTSSEIL